MGIADGRYGDLCLVLERQCSPSILGRPSVADINIGLV